MKTTVQRLVVRFVVRFAVGIVFGIGAYAVAMWVAAPNAPHTDNFYAAARILAIFVAVAASTFPGLTDNV